MFRAALAEAGFEVVAVGDEYTHEPAGASTLRATWTATAYTIEAGSKLAHGLSRRSARTS